MDDLPGNPFKLLLRDELKALHEQLVAIKGIQSCLLSLEVVDEPGLCRSELPRSTKCS